MKKMYEYDSETGEFRSESNATKNPKKPGEYLARVNATFDPVPDTKEKEVAVWNGGEWEAKPDYRGTTYYIRNGDGQIEAITIKNFGELVPNNGYLNIEDIPLTLAEKTQQARAKRDGLLSSTDWYVVRAAEPDGKPVPEDVLAYRQALREIDQHPGWPETVNWPVLPE